MEDKETINHNKSESTEIVSSTTPEESSNALVLNKADLDKESLEIINQIISENDVAKTKDLTYLFNINQNKKTMIRVNKLNELLDVIADQTMRRFAQRPDEISNQELLQGLKVVQDIVERGQKQVAGATETPLIQVNQQNNEINLGDAGEGLTRESRDRVKNAVLAILAGINDTKTDATPQDVVDVTPSKTEENK